MKKIETGDSVVVARNIIRSEGPYASAGEEGVVEEIFRPTPTGSGEVKAWYAKVRMAKTKLIKTFRLTSLKLKEPVGVDI